MKYFIVTLETENEFTIYKVSEELVEGFKEKYQGKILTDGNNIQEIMINFSNLEKPYEFTSELKRFKKGKS